VSFAYRLAWHREGRGNSPPPLQSGKTSAQLLTHGAPTHDRAACNSQVDKQIHGSKGRVNPTSVTFCVAAVRKLLQKLPVSPAPETGPGGVSPEPTAWSDMLEFCRSRCRLLCIRHSARVRGTGSGHRIYARPLKRHHPTAIMVTRTTWQQAINKHKHIQYVLYRPQQRAGKSPHSHTRGLKLNSDHPWREPWRETRP
jgi:hypothetical protein